MNAVAMLNDQSVQAVHAAPSVYRYEPSRPQYAKRGDPGTAAVARSAEPSLSASEGHVVKVKMNRELSRPVTTVVDADTKEVIQEIPAKEIQRIAVSLKKAIGLIFDSEG